MNLRNERADNNMDAWTREYVPMSIRTVQAALVFVYIPTIADDPHRGLNVIYKDYLVG